MIDILGYVAAVVIIGGNGCGGIFRVSCGLLARMGRGD